MGFAQIELIANNRIERPTVDYTIGAKQTFHITLKDTDGAAVNLTPYQEDQGVVPVQHNTAYTLPFGQGIFIIAIENYGAPLPTYLGSCDIVGNPTDGVVQLQLDVDAFRKPGLFLAEVQLVSEEVRQHFHLYLEVSTTTGVRLDGPITVSEVRMWSRDNTADDNFLLDETEFKTAEIVAAIRRGVDIWNSTTPLLRRHNYTPTNFPTQFRSQWLDITLGLLKKMVADNLVRNTLPSSTGGVSIQDKARTDTYRQDYAQAMDQYLRWVKDTKAQLNMQGAFGRLGTYYNNF